MEDPNSNSRSQLINLLNVDLDVMKIESELLNQQQQSSLDKGIHANMPLSSRNYPSYQVINGITIQNKASHAQIGGFDSSANRKVIQLNSSPPRNAYQPINRDANGNSFSKKGSYGIPNQTTFTSNDSKVGKNFSPRQDLNDGSPQTQIIRQIFQSFDQREEENEAFQNSQAKRGSPGYNHPKLQVKGQCFEPRMSRNDKKIERFTVKQSEEYQVKDIDTAPLSKEQKQRILKDNVHQLGFIPIFENENEHVKSKRRTRGENPKRALTMAKQEISLVSSQKSMRQHHKKGRKESQSPTVANKGQSQAETSFRKDQSTKNQTRQTNREYESKINKHEIVNIPNVEQPNGARWSIDQIQSIKILSPGQQSRKKQWKELHSKEQLLVGPVQKQIVAGCIQPLETKIDGSQGSLTNHQSGHRLGGKSNYQIIHGRSKSQLVAAEQIYKGSLGLQISKSNDSNKSGATKSPDAGSTQKIRISGPLNELLKVDEVPQKTILDNKSKSLDQDSIEEQDRPLQDEELKNISKHEIRALIYQLRNIPNLTIEQVKEMLQAQTGLDIEHLLKFYEGVEDQQSPERLSKQLSKQMYSRKKRELEKSAARLRITEYDRIMKAAKKLHEDESRKEAVQTGAISIKDGYRGTSIKLDQGSGDLEIDINLENAYNAQNNQGRESQTQSFAITGGASPNNQDSPEGMRKSKFEKLIEEVKMRPSESISELGKHAELAVQEANMADKYSDGEQQAETKQELTNPGMNVTLLKPFIEDNQTTDLKISTLENEQILDKCKSQDQNISIDKNNAGSQKLLVLRQVSVGDQTIVRQQQSPGVLSGNVGSVGSPLANILISLENTAGTKHMSQQTSSDGLEAHTDGIHRLSPAGSIGQDLPNLGGSAINASFQFGMSTMANAKLLQENSAPGFTIIPGKKQMVTLKSQQKRSPLAPYEQTDASKKRIQTNMSSSQEVEDQRVLIANTKERSQHFNRYQMSFGVPNMNDAMGLILRNGQMDSKANWFHGTSFQQSSATFANQSEQQFRRERNIGDSTESNLKILLKENQDAPSKTSSMLQNRQKEVNRVDLFFRGSYKMSEQYKPINQVIQVFDQEPQQTISKSPKQKRKALAASLDSSTALHELKIKQKREFVMQKQPDRRKFQNIALQQSLGNPPKFVQGKELSHQIQGHKTSKYRSIEQKIQYIKIRQNEERLSMPSAMSQQASGEFSVQPSHRTGANPSPNQKMRGSVHIQKILPQQINGNMALEKKLYRMTKQSTKQIFANAGDVTLNHSKASRSDEYGEPNTDQVLDSYRVVSKKHSSGLQKVDTEVVLGQGSKEQAMIADSIEGTETPKLGHDRLSNKDMANLQASINKQEDQPLVQTADVSQQESMLQSCKYLHDSLPVPQETSKMHRESDGGGKHKGTSSAISKVGDSQKLVATLNQLEPSPIAAKKGGAFQNPGATVYLSQDSQSFPQQHSSGDSNQSAPKDFNVNPSIALNERKSVLMITQENQNRRPSRRSRPLHARNSQATQLSHKSRDLEDVYQPTDEPQKPTVQKRASFIPKQDNYGNIAVTESEIGDSTAQKQEEGVQTSKTRMAYPSMLEIKQNSPQTLKPKLFQQDGFDKSQAKSQNRELSKSSQESQSDNQQIFARQQSPGDSHQILLVDQIMDSREQQSRQKSAIRYQSTEVEKNNQVVQILTDQSQREEITFEVEQYPDHVKASKDNFAGQTQVVQENQKLRGSVEIQTSSPGDSPIRLSVNQHETEYQGDNNDYVPNQREKPMLKQIAYSTLGPKTRQRLNVVGTSKLIANKRDEQGKVPIKQNNSPFRIAQPTEIISEQRNQRSLMARSTQKIGSTMTAASGFQETPLMRGNYQEQTSQNPSAQPDSKSVSKYDHQQAQTARMSDVQSPTGPSKFLTHADRKKQIDNLQNSPYALISNKFIKDMNLESLQKSSHPVSKNSTQSINFSIYKQSQERYRTLDADSHGIKNQSDPRKQNTKSRGGTKISTLGDPNYKTYVKPRSLMGKRAPPEVENVEPEELMGPESRSRHTRDLLKQTSPDLKHKLDFIEKEGVRMKVKDEEHTSRRQLATIVSIGEDIRHRASNQLSTGRYSMHSGSMAKEESQAFPLLQSVQQEKFQTRVDCKEDDLAALQRLSQSTFRPYHGPDREIFKPKKKLNIPTDRRDSLVSSYLRNMTNLRTLTDFNASHNLHRDSIKMNQLKVRSRQIKLLKEVHHTQADLQSNEIRTSTSPSKEFLKAGGLSVQDTVRKFQESGQIELYSEQSTPYPEADFQRIESLRARVNNSVDTATFKNILRSSQPTAAQAKLLRHQANYKQNLSIERSKLENPLALSVIQSSLPGSRLPSISQRGTVPAHSTCNKSLCLDSVLNESTGRTTGIHALRRDSVAFHVKMRQQKKQKYDFQRIGEQELDRVSQIVDKFVAQELNQTHEIHQEINRINQKEQLEESRQVTQTTDRRTNDTRLQQFAAI